MTASNHILSLWTQDRLRLHEASTYAAGGPGILYVPTAAGFTEMADTQGLAAWLGAAGESPYGLAMKWKAQLPEDTDISPIQFIKSTQSGADIMEEVIISFCHDSNIGWLLPGIAPSRKVIQLAMVISASYDMQTEKLAALRVYWDQASVLTQIGAFDAMSLAKATALQGRLDSMPMLSANAAARAMLEGEGMNPFLKAEAIESATSSRPSSGRTVNSIFPGDSASVVQRSSIRLGSNGGYKHADNNIFGTTPVKNAGSGIVANAARYRSHFGGSDNFGVASGTPKYGAGKKHFAGNPNYNDSEASVVSDGHQGKKHFAGNPNYNDSQASLISDGYNAELGDAAPEEAFQRYANNEGLAAAGQQRPASAASISSRAHYGNASQFSLGGEQPEAANKIGGMSGDHGSFHTGKKTNSSKTHSQFQIGSVQGGSDAANTGTSDLYMHGRPSSRVLAPPGGGSNITFG